MERRERTVKNLVRAGAILNYCVAFARNKGTHKDKCDAARSQLAVEFPGVTKEVIAEIERLSLVQIENTITYNHGAKVENE